MGIGRAWNYKGTHRKLMGVTIMSYCLDYDDGFTDAYIQENVSTYTL